MALRNLDLILARGTLKASSGAHRVLGEIAGILVDIQQRLARSPFGIDHVMGFELEVEELEFVEFIGSIERDRCAVYQIPCAYQHAVDEQRVQRRQIKICMRRVRAESRSGNSDRPHIICPRLA